MKHDVPETLLWILYVRRGFGCIYLEESFPTKATILNQSINLKKHPFNINCQEIR